MSMRKLLSFILLTALLAACTPPAPAATSTPVGPSPTVTLTAPPSPTPYPTSTLVPTPVAGTLFVDTAVDQGPISKYIYGSNFGPWTSFPGEMFESAVNSHVSVLRWPGGEWGDRNNISGFQIDTFMGLLKKMGADATISVRLRDGSPEAAAGLVQYVNIEQKYNVRYWSIGNEPNLFGGSMGKPYDAEQLNREWRAIAIAMKAVDPTIQLLGPELSQFTGNPASNPKDSQGHDFMTEFLKANGDLTDIVTIHRYPYPVGAAASAREATMDEMRSNSAEWDSTMPYLRGLIHEITGRDIPIGITEISSYYSPAVGGQTTPDSFYNAIWYGDVMGHFIKQQAFMANVWVFGSRGGGQGLIFGNELRPTYYVFQMYSHFGTQQVYAASGIPNLSIYAAKREDGTLTLMVINLADAAQTVPLQVQGMSVSTAGTWLFDATHNAEDIGATDLAGGKLTLPAQSITLFELPKK